jgi:DNA-binding XRE family transcriptional regulator
LKDPAELLAREVAREAGFLSERWRAWLLEQLRADFKAADLEQHRIDQLNKKMSEAVIALQQVAKYLKLKKTEDQLRLTKREFDAVPEKVRRSWTAHRVANAIRGSWELAKAVAFTDEYLPVKAERHWEQRKGLARKRKETALTLAAIQRWLESEPPYKSKAAYEQWSKAENRKLKPGERRVPQSEGIWLRWRLPFQKIVTAVEAGEVPGTSDEDEPQQLPEKSKITKPAGPAPARDREHGPAYVLDPALRARRLRENREAKNWTLKRLADEIGVDQSSLRSIESGRVQQPSFEMIAKLAEALNLRLDDFATGD